MKKISALIGMLGVLYSSSAAASPKQLNPFPNYDIHSGIEHSLMEKFIAGEYFRYSLDKYLKDNYPNMDKDKRIRIARISSLSLFLSRELFDGITSQKIGIRDDKEGFSLMDIGWGALGTILGMGVEFDALGLEFRISYDPSMRLPAGVDSHRDPFYYNPSGDL